MFSFFFFNDTATTEIYTLSLHDALPISTRDPGVVRGSGACDNRPAGGRRRPLAPADHARRGRAAAGRRRPHPQQDRKSTRLNSSHSQISYAVFCLKKKKKKQVATHTEHR